MASERMPEKGERKAAKQKGTYLQLSVLENGIIKVDNLKMHSQENLQEWFPGIEWLDESEPDQDELWNEIKEIVWHQSLHAYLSAASIEILKPLYTLIRK